MGNDYPQPFIVKVRAGELPEFIHLPAEGTVIKNESMAVLTHLQSHSESAVEGIDLALDAVGEDMFPRVVTALNRGGRAGQKRLRR